jgi:hypothetical protein
MMKLTLTLKLRIADESRHRQSGRSGGCRCGEAAKLAGISTLSNKFITRCMRRSHPADQPNRDQ